MCNQKQLPLFKYLPSIKEIIDSTMAVILTRHSERPSYPWINLKLDALNGTDYFDESGIRGKEHVYSWIQGRGLEALVMHARWYERFSGYINPDRKELIKIATSVAYELEISREAGKGHLHFFVSHTRQEDGRFSMSDLFCARGLYAYHKLYSSCEQVQKATDYLKSVVKAVITNNFYNDQESFGSSQYIKFDDGRTSYAGYMLALGGVNLLMQLGQDPEAPQLGWKLIEYVLERHVQKENKFPTLQAGTIVEWIDPDGRASRDSNGSIALDPGHALEFIGLSAQVLLAWRTNYTLDTKAEVWISDVESLLPDLLWANLQQGYSHPGGILKSVDGESGAPLHDSMPWWSLPETLRAIALVEHLGKEASWSNRATQWFSTCYDAFKTYYYDRSAIGIAIQTINRAGEPVPIIPATPDLDPGYHTGLALISCYEVLALQALLLYSGTEVDITPDLGCRLSGHVARSSPATQVLDPLGVRLALLQGPYGKVGVLSADVLEFSQEWIRSIKPQIAELWSIGEGSILLSATHTHTAPPVINLGMLAPDNLFMSKLSDKILEGCKRAIVNHEAVTLEVATFTSSVGINRRWFDTETKKTTMRPNPEGSRDDDVLVLALRNLRGAIRSIWVNTAIHPTTLGVSLAAISADYPGRMSRTIKKYVGDDVTVIPFTGACGDVRPAVIDSQGKYFREGKEADIDYLGEKLGKGVVEALKESRLVAIPSGGVSIRFEQSRVSLALNNIPSKDELRLLVETNAQRYEEALAIQDSLDTFTKMHDNPLWTVQMEYVWAKRLLEYNEIPQTLEAELGLLSLHDQVYIFTIPGELFSAVGKSVKQLAHDKFAMVAGYTGGSLGYLPSQAAMDEGGYEIHDAFKYYGHAGPFSKDLESTILKTIKTLITKIQHDK